MTHGTAGPAVTTAMAVVKTLILITGGVITYFAFRAYRRTDSRSLGALALGFGLITMGTFLAGVVADVIGMSLAVGVLTESVLVLAGFLVIAYSLYTR
ncbi:DUF7521 family protein [Natronoarchaeum rubrum]|uniref:DUF7521 family protein n=1 Tax=Natronoarchaeum rubrum TaxID=755311 RepID=UPI00211385FF|nr:hypothetical protein [Natronoarchaeum rubrum]HMB50757.1 hypothetical protein [Natronoarchaeum rubrum]